MSADRAGWMLSFATVVGMVGALSTPCLSRRLGDGAATVVIAVTLNAIGYVGLIADPIPAIYVWLICIGLAQGACISLAIHYIIARSPDQHHTGTLSAMAQGFGYLVACSGPVALGAIHHLTGGWTVSVSALIAVLALQLAAGLLASRDRHVLGG
jgi:CP family cyanate transporter-like MFS transporter